MENGLTLQKMKQLLDLEEYLTQLMCGGIREEASRRAMESMVTRYIEEEAVKFSEEELATRFDTVEESFKLFFGYLLAKGVVQVEG
ncbi:hypothetical protein [Desulforhabdus sp. TSK]|uniref:hypothetical protein n=1 Tax=Desulforhabdus sp. TSK TaxID=2925014 RepID=UPI001FC7EE5E|nr:hypothetical protein [Desulforhabdus sp. TSK]GKT09476.1 hypothetical protein DSTSK_27810 [Desulforhabdus sp. TSK]